ncbi:hypothetical protein ACX0HA_10905 [Flavobacterium hauense]
MSEEDSIWKSFASQINGNYIEQHYWHSDKTEITYNNWKITFDNYTEYRTVANSDVQQTYTRVTAPYITIDGFKFKIARKSIISSIVKLFGGQDIEIGDVIFDQNFVIKSNNPSQVNALLKNNEIRRWIEEQPKINLEISNQKGIWEDKLPDKELELSFFVEGRIKDIDRLKSIYKLFTVLLNQLYEIGSIIPKPNL